MDKVSDVYDDMIIEKIQNKYSTNQRNETVTAWYCYNVRQCDAKVSKIIKEDLYAFFISSQTFCVSDSG